MNTMAWYENLWPFNRAKLEERRQIEAEFQKQLDAAIERRGDLEEAARQLREDREQRQLQLSHGRPKFKSRPSFQE